MGNKKKQTKIIASVIVCTYNRASLLRRNLESLGRQSIEPELYEVIVVDDGSDDDTDDLVREMSAGHPMLRLFETGINKGSCVARNLGLDSATGKYILFTDDDCIAMKDWVENMCDTLDHHPIVAGSIRSPESGYVKLCHNIAHFHPFMPGPESGPVDFLAGANMGFRRSVIDELGGFDDAMILAGDMQLCLRARSMGYQPYLSQKAVVVHDPDYISLSRAIRSSYMHAATTVLLRNEYRSLLHTPFILKYPVLISLASPVIALSVALKIYLRNPRLFSSFWTAPFVYILKVVWCFGAASGLMKSKKMKKTGKDESG
jgi:glycosyltransferase involved in cell wall biosynthesis